MVGDLIIRRSVFIIDRGAEELRERIRDLFASPTGAQYDLPAPKREPPVV